MGCKCTNGDKTIRPIQIELNPSNSLSNVLKLLSHSDLKSYSRSPRYRLVLWSHKQAALDALRKSLPSVLEIETINLKVYFSYFPVTSVSCPVPRAVDGLICVVNDYHEDSSYLPSILDKFSKVWSQPKLYSDASELLIMQEYAKHLKLPLFTEINNLLFSVLEDDLKIHINCRSVFAKVDKDQNGLIDQLELAIAGSRLGKSMNDTEISQVMQELDQNSDGKINFEEFLNWWKRGTQGVFPVRDKMSPLVNLLYVAFKERKVDSLLHSKEQVINKRTVQKTVKIECGEVRSGISFSLCIGKGAQKDRIIHEVNSLFSFFHITNWVAFEFTGEPPSVESERFKIAGDKFFYAKAFEAKQKLDWISPVDEFLNLQGVIACDLENLVSCPEGCSLEGFNADLDLHHWTEAMRNLSKISEKFSPLSLLYSWASGSSKLKFKNASAFFKWTQIGNLKNRDLELKIRKLLSHVLDDSLRNLIRDSNGNLRVLLRFQNFAVDFKVTGVKSLIDHIL